MSLVLATGSNLGAKLNYLNEAQKLLEKAFTLIQVSPVYESSAVDFLDQPSFYNQLLEFQIPNISPAETLKMIMKIENTLGRERNIEKGPRTIDIDIIFWSLDKINEVGLTIPHPSWNKRSFVVKPLQHLPFFETVKKHYIIPTQFDVDAKPIN